MKNVIGFAVTDEIETGKPEIKIPAEAVCDSEPVPSVVSVEFENDGIELSYYNDRFALEIGDRVFVEGKYAGKLGTVTKVSTKFKIRRSDYKRVIARPRIKLSGTFESVKNMMVSRGAQRALTEEFRSLLIPPKENEGDGEYILGEGFRVGLFSSEDGDEIEEKIVKRALDYCRNGNVLFVSADGGIGTAFVKGSETYEVNFRIERNAIADTYCSCPYPGLCKHMVATVIILNSLIEELSEAVFEQGFTAINSSLFMQLAMATGKITVEGE